MLFQLSSLIITYIELPNRRSSYIEGPEFEEAGRGRVGCGGTEDVGEKESWQYLAADLSPQHAAPATPLLARPASPATPLLHLEIPSEDSSRRPSRSSLYSRTSLQPLRD